VAVESPNLFSGEILPMCALSLDKLKVVKSITRPEIVFAQARVPNSRLIFFGGSDFKVHELSWDDSKPEAKELGSHSSYVTGLALSGNTLVSGAYDGRLIWWDTESRTQIRSLDAHAKWIRRVAASPDGNLVASVADDMVCRIWEISSGRLIHELRGHEESTPHHFPSMLFACAFSPDGRHIATADKVGHIVVWEVETGQKLNALEAPALYTWDPVQRRHSIGGIRALAFSPDGTRLAAGGVGPIGNIDHLEGKARVEVFDWRKGERTHEFPGDKFQGLVESLVFHPQGDWLLAAGGYSDGFFMFFDLGSKKVMQQEKVPFYVHDLALNENADTAFAVGHHRIAVLEMKS
jgi:WD40 repeat protein